MEEGGGLFPMAAAAAEAEEERRRKEGFRSYQRLLLLGPLLPYYYNTAMYTTLAFATLREEGGFQGADEERETEALNWTRIRP